MNRGLLQPLSRNTPDDLKALKDTTLKLLAYCSANNWSGYDPYDALNSRLYRSLPLFNFKAARLLLTQAVKRCPINLRPLLLVAKTPNPKGIALFLASLSRLSKMGMTEDGPSIEMMANKLLSLRSPDHRYACWGYNFDWQTRTKLVPKGSPNIICSTFAANALLDAFEQLRWPTLLNAAISTAEFILDVLFFQEDNSRAFFSYTPLERSRVHNANLLGAAFLCRIAKTSDQKRFLEPALSAARYSVEKQHENGSWDYGESRSQRWIDNFHTGFNLVALKRITEYGGTPEFADSISRGFIFFRDHFFREDGAPKYFHNATYPIDIHSVSQSIITLVEFRDSSKECLDLALSVLKWAMNNMWDTRGFFYFQKMPHFTVRTPFMRWSQAWMLLSLSLLLDACHNNMSKNLIPDLSF